MLGLGLFNSPTFGQGVLVSSGAVGTLIQNNTMSNTRAGIAFQNSGLASAATISGNIIRDGQVSNADGIELNGGNSNMTISNNQILRYAGCGIDFIGGASTGNTITGNTFAGNGTATDTGQLSGISLRGAGSSNNTISRNTFLSNNGSGIVALSGTTGNVFSQNSFFGNGTIAKSAGAGQGLAIDLTATTDTNGDGVTRNDAGDADTGANGQLNFPVITSASIVGTSLVVKGYARAGALIELYGVGATADPTGFGEG